MAKLPTTRITAAGALGYRIINQSDFDRRQHEIYQGPDSGLKKGMSPLPELAEMSNKDLAAWGREALGLADMDGRQAREMIMKRINVALAARRDG